VQQASSQDRGFILTRLARVCRSDSENSASAHPGIPPNALIPKASGRWGYADPAPPPQSDTAAGEPGDGKGGSGAGKGSSGGRQGGGTAKHSGSSKGGSTRKGGGKGSGKGSGGGANSGGKTAARRRRLAAHQHLRRRLQAADSDRQRDSWLTGLNPSLQVWSRA